MIRRGGRLYGSHMTVDAEFSAIRLMNLHLDVTDWSLSFDIMGTANTEESTNSYFRLMYWIDGALDDSIITDTSPENVNLSGPTKNNVVVCPDLPTDDVLVKLIHSKMSQIAGKSLVIGATRLKSNRSNVTFVYDPGRITQDRALPSDTSYFTLWEPAHAQPWWMRNDGFTYEPTAELSEEELIQCDIMSSYQMEDDSDDADLSADQSEPVSARPTGRVISAEDWTGDAGQT